MTDPFDFSGKTVVITGGSRGLGRAMALAFAERGANIVVASRKIEACEAAAEECRALGGNARAIAVNAGHWESLNAFADEAWAAFGSVDVLINNAGMSLLSSSSLQTPEAMFDKVVALNFKGPFRLCALFGSRMAAGDGGSIINISSTGSIRPKPEFAPYAGAKAALNAITQAFSFEFAPKVRVNAILPGPFATDVAKSWDPEKERKLNSALKRFGRPREIVTAALYFASEASSFTTGTLLRVDGGKE